MDHHEQYSFYDSRGTEHVCYRGPALGHDIDFVIDMVLGDDKWGYNIYGDRCYRNNIRFTGLLIDGIPFLGRLTFEYIGIKYTLEGKFNSKAQVIGNAKQTSTGPYDMIAIG